MVAITMGGAALPLETGDRKKKVGNQCTREISFVGSTLPLVSQF